MKCYIKSLVIASCFSLALVFGGLSALTGCSSTPQRIIYNSEKTVQVSIEVALSAWDAYVKSGKSNLEQERKVKQLVTNYRKSALLAHDLVDSYINIAAKGDPNETTNAKLKADQAATEASKILSDLIGLLTSFGVKVV